MQLLDLYYKLGAILHNIHTIISYVFVLSLVRFLPTRRHPYAVAAGLSGEPPSPAYAPNLMPVYVTASTPPVIMVDDDQVDTDVIVIPNTDVIFIGNGDVHTDVVVVSPDSDAPKTPQTEARRGKP